MTSRQKDQRPKSTGGLGSSDGGKKGIEGRAGIFRSLAELELEQELELESNRSSAVMYRFLQALGRLARVGAGKRVALKAATSSSDGLGGKRAPGWALRLPKDSIVAVAVEVCDRGTR